MSIASTYFCTAVEMMKPTPPTILRSCFPSRKKDPCRQCWEHSSFPHVSQTPKKSILMLPPLEFSCSSRRFTRSVEASPLLFRVPTNRCACRFHVLILADVPPEIIRLSPVVFPWAAVRGPWGMRGTEALFVAVFGIDSTRCWPAKPDSEPPNGCRFRGIYCWTFSLPLAVPPP